MLVEEPWDSLVTSPGGRRPLVPGRQRLGWPAEVLVQRSAASSAPPPFPLDIPWVLQKTVLARCLGPHPLIILMPKCIKEAW